MEFCASYVEFQVAVSYWKSAIYKLDELASALRVFRRSKQPSGQNLNHSGSFFNRLM